MLSAPAASSGYDQLLLLATSSSYAVAAIVVELMLSGPAAHGDDQ